MSLWKRYVPSITRIVFSRDLRRILKNITQAGEVLDVGSSIGPYQKLLTHNSWIKMDIDEVEGLDVNADAHRLPFPDSIFDSVLLIEVIGHCRDPKSVVDDIFRVLKPGGMLILSTRFIYFYHPYPKDYYRFTQDSLSALCRSFSDIKIFPHGNRIQSSWQILMPRYEFPLPIAPFIFGLNHLVSHIDFKDNKCPGGYIIARPQIELSH